MRFGLGSRGVACHVLCVKRFTHTNNGKRADFSHMMSMVRPSLLMQRTPCMLQPFRSKKGTLLRRHFCAELQSELLELLGSLVWHVHALTAAKIRKKASSPSSFIGPVEPDSTTDHCEVDTSTFDTPLRAAPARAQAPAGDTRARAAWAARRWP